MAVAVSAAYNGDDQAIARAFPPLSSSTSQLVIRAGRVVQGNPGSFVQTLQERYGAD